MACSTCRAIVAPEVVYPGGPGPFYSLDQGLGKREPSCDFVAANLRQGAASHLARLLRQKRHAMLTAPTKTAAGSPAASRPLEPGTGWERFRS